MSETLQEQNETNGPTQVYWHYHEFATAHYGQAKTVDEAVCALERFTGFPLRDCATVVSPDGDTTVYFDKVDRGLYYVGTITLKHEKCRCDKEDEEDEENEEDEA